MTKNAIVLLLMIVVGNAFSQNLMQQQFSNIGLSNQSVMQQQRNTVLASNVANTNKQQQRQNVQRQSIQQVVNQYANPPLPIQNIDVQKQSNAAENNIGNELINIQQIQPLANIAPPQQQFANGNAFEIKLPSLNIGIHKTIKTSKTESNSVKHRLMVFEKSIKKLNRKLATKLSIKKKLKIKVDDCFKW